MISPGKAETLTERDCQLAIFKYRERISAWPILLTNIYFFSWWESDVLFVTRSGYFHEFEIKLSRSDFKADKKKSRKHDKLERGCGPSEFYYVCPANMISIDEVPDYAGLAYVTSLGSLVIKKKAPRQRDALKIKPEHWQTLADKSCRRHWDEIMRSERVEELARTGRVSA